MVFLLLGLWQLGDLSYRLQPDCYTNGTMTALAVKVESVPNLVPSWLTLKDESCKPVSSDDRFAYFSFTVDSCGTTRVVNILTVLLLQTLNESLKLAFSCSSSITTWCMKIRLAYMRTKEHFTHHQWTLNTGKKSAPVIMMHLDKPQFLFFFPL